MATRQWCEWVHKDPRHMTKRQEKIVRLPDILDTWMLDRRLGLETVICGMHDGKMTRETIEPQATLVKGANEPAQ
jgi:hypothetical protein